MKTFKLFIFSITIIALILFAAEDSNCQALGKIQNKGAKLTVFEKEDPFVETQRPSIESTLLYTDFDFNDGTLQGWTTYGPLDEDGDGPFSSHFGTSWGDAVSYPSPGLSDPIGNNHGSYKICNVSGHGITNPGATYWVMYYISPNLSTSTSWQNAGSYTVKILNYMEKIAPAPGDHLVLYVNLHITVYDHDQSRNRYFSCYGGAQPIDNYIVDPVWIHKEYDLSTVFSTVPNHTVEDVYVSIWGEMDDYFEGGIYLDEVEPVSGGPTPYPEITVNPSYFNVTLGAGETTVETMTIGNIGDANLTFNIVESPAAGIKQSPNIDQTDISPNRFIPNEPKINDRNGDGIVEFDVTPSSTKVENYANTKPTNLKNGNDVMITGWGYLNPDPAFTDFVNHIISLGYNVTTSNTFPASLAGYEILILVGGGSANEDIPEGTVDAFVSAGNGLIIFEGVVWAGDFSTTAGSNPVQSISGWDLRNNANVVAPANPLCAGVSTSCTFEGWSTQSTMKAGTQVAMRWNDGVVFAATYEYSGGKVVYINDLWAWHYLNMWAGDPANGRTLMENALDYVSDVDLSWLSFSPASGTVTPGSSQNISITLDATSLSAGTYQSNLVINNNDTDENPTIVPVTLQVTGGSPCLLGDVNDDGAVTPGDALCAFQIYLYGGTPPPECDNPCALEAADVNCTPNGITPGDALYIFQAYLSSETPPLDCDPTTTSARSRPDVEISLVKIESTEPDEITVAIQMSNPEGLTAFGIDLGFPDDVLSLIEVKSASLTELWQAVDGLENVAGVVSIGGFNDEAVSVSSSGYLATVTFRVMENASGDVEFWMFNKVDDLADAKLTAKSYLFPLAVTNVHKIDPGNVPETFSLDQNYPNPFNMQTEIVYQLPEAAQTTLAIYNSMGQEIRTLVSQKQDAGRYAAHWDGRDNNGKNLPSGVYIYKLSTSKFVSAKKLFLIK